MIRRFDSVEKMAEAIHTSTKLHQAANNFERLYQREPWFGAIEDLETDAGNRLVCHCKCHPPKEIWSMEKFDGFEIVFFPPKD